MKVNCSELVKACVLLRPTINDVLGMDRRRHIFDLGLIQSYIYYGCSIISPSTNSILLDTNIIRYNNYYL